jgi:hypothetical protein
MLLEMFNVAAPKRLILEGASSACAHKQSFWIPKKSSRVRYEAQAKACGYRKSLRRTPKFMVRRCAG